MTAFKVWYSIGINLKKTFYIYIYFFFSCFHSGINLQVELTSAGPFLNIKSYGSSRSDPKTFTEHFKNHPLNKVIYFPLAGY